MKIMTGIVLLFLFGACNKNPEEQLPKSTTTYDELMKAWDICDFMGDPDDQTEFQLKDKWNKGKENIPDKIEVFGIADNVMYIEQFGATVVLKPYDTRGISVIFGVVPKTLRDAVLKVNKGDRIFMTGNINKDISCSDGFNGFSVWMDVSGLTAGEITK